MALALQALGVQAQMQGDYARATTLHQEGLALFRQLDDRRVVKTRITSEGLDILRKLDAPVQDLHKRQFRNISGEHLKGLAAALEEILQKAPEAT